MTEQPTALRLADDVALNHKYCPVEVLQEAAAELRRLSAIEEAAKNLVKVKCRYHTEQAFNTLKELLK